MSTVADADVVVIGAGIAGASIAYFLAPHAKVLMLEREPHVGFHSTGRSAALFMETYGSDQVRALTRASRPFLTHPPQGFAPYPLTSPRGALIIGAAQDTQAVQNLYEAFLPHSPGVELQTAEQLRNRVPVLKPEAAHIGLHDPAAMDLDVNELLQGYLRGMRSHGGRLLSDVTVDAIERVQNHWQVRSGERIFRAPLLVNAAGAWVDIVAAMAGVHPIGIEPRRRSAFIFAPPEGVNVTSWPFVMNSEETFYFKPDAELLLGSAANADPDSPHDVQPEELDIALGIHRIEEATTMRITRPLRTWAGLRSFVADGDLVGGFAPDAEGFFWLAAQGGYGVQTSAAMGEACANLLLGRDLPSHLLAEGISSAMLAVRSNRKAG